MSLTLSTLPDGRRAVIIRTSDRIAFKQCRRKWAWSSHLKKNLGAKNLAGPLWFGSAIHYALEDYHGYNVFGNPADAFRAYCIATSKQHIRDLPSDAVELFELGSAMMDYYVNSWLNQSGRPVDQTYWYNDPITDKLIPGVEVNFELEVPLDDPAHSHLKDFAERIGADVVLYRGTMDRVAIDEYGRLWVVEYKTAKRAEHLHYQTDPQVTTYTWAAQHIFDKPVAGVIYMQFVKNMPKVPQPLSSGKISTASNLATSGPLYQRALTNMYGSVEKAPEANRKFLTDLLATEDENKDRYIQRNRVERNAYQLDMEAQKILLELEDILNPNLPLYPNPTRDCSRMCGFLSACVAFDAGADWQNILDDRFSQRDQDADRFWRRRLPAPEKLKALREINLTPDLEEMQVRLQGMPQVDQEAVALGEQEVEFSFTM